MAIGNIPADKRGSSLVEKCGDGHAKQPSGTSIGVPERAPHAEGPAFHMGEAHTFKPPAASNAHGFGHPAHTRSGPLRMSGHSGAHRIGKKR